MLYMAGGPHLPVKSAPSRQVIGPRPPVPPMPTANFFTLGRMTMQSAFATVLAGTSLLPTIARNTVSAFLMVSSSLFLSAPQTGRAKHAITDTSRIGTDLLAKLFILVSYVLNCPECSSVCLAYRGWFSERRST